jgi:hypothetical protein
MSTASDGSVKMLLPEWIWARKPKDFLKAACLMGRPVSGERGIRHVRTEEAHAGQRSGLLTMNHIAGPVTKREPYDLVTGRAVPNQVRASDEAIATVNQIGEDAAKSGKLVDRLLARLATPPGREPLTFTELMDATVRKAAA